jgi:hypothetical protein
MDKAKVDEKRGIILLIARGSSVCLGGMVKGVIARMKSSLCGKEKGTDFKNE